MQDAARHEAAIASDGIDVPVQIANNKPTFGFGTERENKNAEIWD